MTNYLSVRISNPKKVVWEGEAVSVSSVNTQGAFDILPQHANFITYTENQPIIIRTKDKNVVEHTFKNTVMYVRENKVNVYTDLE